MELDLEEKCPIMDCLFCKIIEGKISAEKIFESGNLIAIKDISPQAPIHYLFIPKSHLDGVNALPPKSTLMSEIFSAIQEVAAKEGFAQNGFRTVINTNKNGGQTVYHLHVHLLAGAALSGYMSGL